MSHPIVHTCKCEVDVVVGDSSEVILGWGWSLGFGGVGGGVGGEGSEGGIGQNGLCVYWDNDQGSVMVSWLVGVIPSSQDAEFFKGRSGTCWDTMDFGCGVMLCVQPIMSPAILVLGGVGFIGRNFVAYVVENNLADTVRVVDKVLPQTAYFSERSKKTFEKVEFMQGNLINPDSIEKCYTRADGEQFDYVFNFAGETKYSQTEELYIGTNEGMKEGDIRIPHYYREHVDKDMLHSTNILQSALVDQRSNFNRYHCPLTPHSLSRFPRFTSRKFTTSPSSAPRKPPSATSRSLLNSRRPRSTTATSTEDSKISPWTLVAKYKYKAEEELRKIKGLNLIVLRPALVYGPSAILGITPRLIMGRVYKQLNEEMKLLWNESLRINTVHVEDVCRATWHVANWFVENGKVGSGESFVFNLADKGDTSECWRCLFFGRLTEVMEGI
ncbi:hypothetical protein BC938DRAFT_483812 [Jimgerdemannia flammicorona]|uniref:NAD-dependent epimerase/dehydratase domain-containing protein n=1 Tax=Jimgerdemannia flammicorona TaxID=994334 RepID=A0A433QVL2_9FUNG|nr:hypothetical protein BC938DRAFT_483812 [Jimgerdemannia flammicorona]